MALPILLMVMALFVIFGNATVWKVRTSVAARHAVWRARPPRTGAEDPALRWGAATSRMDVEDAAGVAALDDGRLRHEVVRGRLDPFGVEEDLLDFSRGKVKGTAEMTQHYPMLGKMGEYRFAVEHPLLVDQFRYWEMGIPSNRFRRIPFIYDLPQAPDGFAQAYANAVDAIVNAPFRRDLDALDRDPEIFAYTGAYVDFHPRVPGFCELDPALVQRNYVENTIDRIGGRNRFPSVPSVAERIAQFHISMYRAQLQQGSTDPTLQQKIQQYQQFLNQARGRRYR